MLSIIRLINQKFKMFFLFTLPFSALLLIGCPQNANVINIATKPMTEQLILGEMLAALIENHTDLKVSLIKGVGGGTSNIHPALLKGKFDMYPEYTGTAWSFVLKKDEIPDSGELFAELTREYKERYALEWVGMYGFNNSFGLVVRDDLSRQHNIKTYSDLAPYTDQMTFGAEYDFYERQDGYDALCRAYGFVFKNHIDMDIGLKYPAISSGQIDVMNIFTTDGQLSTAAVTLLEDDKNFYQTYYCGTVVRTATLEKHPELRAVLMLMDNVLDEKAMARLNYEVEEKGRDERTVALEYLNEKGLIREP
jgi:glycine betaine/choline ABC-type transport system substrate-binding protein